MAEKGLTPKQERFVDEYLVDLNVTQAAIRAGYSKATAGSIGANLLKNAGIQAELQKRRQKLQDKLGIRQETVISELAAIAFANGADYAKITPEGYVKFMPTDMLDPAKLKAIAGIKESQSGLEVKLHDKLKAIELLERYLDLFGQQKEAEGPSLADTIIAAYRDRKEKEDAEH